MKSLSLILLAPLTLAACYAQTTDPTNEDDVGAIAEALELDQGGLDMEDELASFGVPETFDELQLLQSDLEVTDPMETSAAVTSMTGAPDAVQFAVAINFILDWDSDPPIEVEPLDTKLVVKLKLTF